MSDEFDQLVREHEIQETLDDARWEAEYQTAFTRDVRAILARYGPIVRADLAFWLALFAILLGMLTLALTLFR